MNPVTRLHAMVNLSEFRSWKHASMLVIASMLFVVPGTSVHAQPSCKVVDPDLSPGTYSGGCRNGLADGYGEVAGTSTYTGGFRDGKKEGKGVKVMPNGDRYEGNFHDDYRDGHGVYVWGDKTPWAGDRYEGEYRRDMRNGWGIYQWNSGDRYEGEWKNDVRQGPSVMEQRRARAAEAAAKSLSPGAVVCAEQRWDNTNIQLIKAIVEGRDGDRVRVRISEIEGGFVVYQGRTLSAGEVFEDQAGHWQACKQI